MSKNNLQLTEKGSNIESTNDESLEGEVIPLSLLGKKVHLSDNVDDAMALATKSTDIELNAKSDRRLVRKIDLYLVPFIILLNAIQYMDKVTTSFGAIMGLKEYYNMVDNLYSWCGSSFYIGYLFFVFFASYLVQRFPPAKTCGIFVIVWGTVNTVTCTSKTYPAFIALRTLLGMLESIITPTMVIITSQWWKKEEQFLRTCFYLSATCFGSFFGYAIAYGLWVHESSYSLPGWKICFLIIGIMTVVLGLIFVVYFPDSPANAWFLSEKEKLQVVERIRSNNQGFGTKVFKWYQVKECLLDYRVWLIFIFGIVDEIPNGAITNFSSILINNLGYDTKQSLLLNLPLGAVGWLGCNLMAALYSLGLVKHRIPISVSALLIAILGTCLLAFGSTNNVQLGGLYIMQVSPLGMIGCLTFYSSNIAGHTKKVVGNALYLVGFCAGNLIGPQTFRDSDAPAFHSAKVTILVCYVLSTTILLILYLSYWLDNKKRNRFAEEHKSDEYRFVENQEFADLTDRENPLFRYTL